MAHRIANTDDGVNCFRCQGFVSPSSTKVVRCACTDVQLIQFASESQADQRLVTDMLFMQLMADDNKRQMSERKKHNKKLQKLYKENEQLAKRNGVRNPFVTTGS